MKTIEALAQVLDVDPGWLAFGERSSASPPVAKRYSFVQSLRAAIDDTIKSSLESVRVSRLSKQQFDQVIAEQLRMAEEVFGEMLVDEDEPVALEQDPSPAPAATPALPSGTSGDTTFERELSKAITRALEHLTPRQREVVEMRWLRQMSFDEIAQQMNISRKTVSMHLSRAMLHLREQLPTMYGDTPQ